MKYMRSNHIIPIFLLSCLAFVGCSVSEVNLSEPPTSAIVSKDETYEKEVEDSYFSDMDSLYEGDEDQVKVIYLTVGYGNAEDGTNHTWSEVNSYPLSYYDENHIDTPYKCEAVLQFGDEDGPVEGEFGYSDTSANATVGLRGKSASEKFQKSYRINIKKGKGSVDDQKILVLNKYISDPLRITDRLAYSLMEDIPSMLSMRTSFVHLYVKDRSEGENGKYVDYGYYTQLEQINKTYLKNHGLDKDGELYEVNGFDWGRHEDSITLATSADFDKEAFEAYLGIKGSDDHSGIVELLEAVNNYDRDIREIVEYYFDEDNLYTWMAFNILMGNKEGVSDNYYLYSPQMTDRWYFISGNNSDSFSEIQNYMEEPYYSESWNTGCYIYSQPVLFKRILQNEECLHKLGETVTGLHDSYLTRKIVEDKATELSGMIKDQIFTLPDSRYIGVTTEEYDELLGRLGEEIDRNYKLYEESLTKPWPFHILTPVINGEELILRWEDSYYLEGELTYTIELDHSYDFADCIVREDLLDTTSYVIPMLEPGQYFLRVSVRGENGQVQDAYEYYNTQWDTTIYSTLCFYVFENGTIGITTYVE